MSRTACCFLALGISVAALAAACGDDDGGDGNTGGSGGSGASGGSGGTAGSAGTAGAGGGTAGSAGAAGDGGAGGGTGGVGGANVGGSAGTPSGGASGAGTVVIPDAGTDSGAEEPDAGDEVDASTGGSGPGPVVDSGVNGNCAGFTTGLADIEPQNNQDVVIARVIFNSDDETATVVLRVTTAFTFGDPMQLCWGASDDECISADDEVTGARAIGTEFPLVVGTEDFPVTSDEGELIFISDFPSTGDGSAFAYVNWGGYDSEDLDAGGPLPSQEELAVAAGLWTNNDSLDLATNNAFFGNGDTSVDTGFGICTADVF